MILQIILIIFIHILTIKQIIQIKKRLFLIIVYLKIKKNKTINYKLL